MAAYKFILAAVALMFAVGDGTQALADSCDSEAGQIAGKIGGTIGGRTAGTGMIQIKRTIATEVTFGCPHYKFLAIFGDPARRSEFLDFLGLAWTAYTGQPSLAVRAVAEQCIVAAKADKDRVFRLPYGKFTLQCGAGIGSDALKVTFE